MFGSLNQSIDQLRIDTFQPKAHRVLRAVERARTQFLQKTKAPSEHPENDVLTGSYFDYLPSELLIDICSRTDWRDLVRLRSVSRAFKEILDAHEHVIVSRMVIPGTYLALLSDLFAPPRARGSIYSPGGSNAPRKFTIQYLQGLEKRHITCSQLAYYLCEKALAPMFNSSAQFTYRREKRDTDSKKEQAIRTVQRKLTKQLYYVLHFLTYSRLRLESAQALHAADNFDDYSAPMLTPSEISSTYSAIQASIIASFDNATLISTHHAMNFLVNSIRLSMSPIPPHNQNDEIVSLMLRCPSTLKRAVEFFAADTPSASRSLRKQFMLDMQDERDGAEQKWNVGLRRSISHSRRSVDVKRDTVWIPRVGEVWFEMAKKALSERGLTEHKPDGVYFFPDCKEELLVGCPNCTMR